MEIKFDNKEQTQKVIDKIGENKDVLDFVLNKIFLLICLYVVWISCFLIMAFKDFSAKDTLSAVGNLCFVVIGIVSIIEHIILINKLQKIKNN